MSGSIWYAAIALLLVASGTGCERHDGPTKSGVPGYVLRGQVRDSLTSEPLAEVTILQGGIRAGSTDGTGAYVVGFLPEQEGLATYRLAGYRSKSFRFPSEVEAMSRYEYRKNVELVPVRNAAPARARFR